MVGGLAVLSGTLYCVETSCATHFFLTLTIEIIHLNGKNCFMLKFALVTLLLLAPATVARASDQRLPLVRFQGCYDGDTCTTTEAEKLRLACINAPDIAKR